jgi:ABC-type Na+ efflux pump permease subunit
MSLRISWIIASKDFKVFRRKETIIYTVILLPFLISILFPLVIEVAGRKSGGNFSCGSPGNPERLRLLLGYSSRDHS